MNVSKKIQRKTLIYKTGVEYGDYTINHIQGCSHSCKYPCYAFLLKKRFGIIKNYEEWIQPAIVENALELLDIEIPKYKNKIKKMHLCFTTDPFMYRYDDISKLSIEILKKFNESGIVCSVLTKGILPKELINLNPNNEYGITLVSIDEQYRQNYEPGAAPFIERINALKHLHENGCKTWVSIEPYPTPNIFEQDLLEILREIDFVDKIIFGRTNYSKEISAYKKHRDFYNKQSEIVIEFCRKNSIDYHIKNGTITDIDQ